MGNNKLTASGIVLTLLFSSPFFSEEIPTPTINLKDVIEFNSSLYGQKYSTGFESIEIKNYLSSSEQLDILKNVITQLVTNPEKVDHEITKLVNENLWELT